MTTSSLGTPTRGVALRARKDMFGGLRSLGRCASNSPLGALQSLTNGARRSPRDHRAITPRRPEPHPAPARTKPLTQPSRQLQAFPSSARPWAPRARPSSFEPRPRSRADRPTTAATPSPSSSASRSTAASTSSRATSSPGSGAPSGTAASTAGSASITPCTRSSPGACTSRTPRTRTSRVRR